MDVNAILPIIRGLECSLVTTEGKRAEDSVRAGANANLAASFQMLQAAKSVDFINEVLKAVESSPVSWMGRVVICVTPYLLTFLKKSLFLPEEIRSGIAFLHAQLGTLYQVAAAVSTLTLLYFGQTLFALPALLVLGASLAERQGWLPVEFRQRWHQYNQPILIVTGFIVGGWIDRIFATLNLLSWGASRALAQTESPATERFAFRENLTPDKARDFLNGRLRVKVERSYIHYQPFPPIPNVDIENLVTLFDRIQWPRHLGVLREKLRRDPRFIEQHRDPDLKTDQEIIALTRHSLKTFVDTVKERRILAGEPADYEKLHNYLKLITRYVQTQNEETTRTDVLFRLAVEGGEYCGPGKFEVVESVYAQTLGENPEIPFPDKVIYCLQDERNRWMNKFYYQSGNAIRRYPYFRTLINSVDWQDVHNYNLFVNLYGPQFGLHTAAAENDSLAVVDPLSKWIMSKTIGKELTKIFWDTHLSVHHTRTLSEAIGTPKLPKPEFYAFWQNWIERQQIGEAEKEALREELANGSLYNRPIEVQGKVTADFVALLLLDMGVLQTTTAPEEQENLVARPSQNYAGRRRDQVDEAIVDAMFAP